MALGYLRGGWFLVSADTVYSSMEALGVDMGMCNAMYDFREACKQTTKTVSGEKIPASVHTLSPSLSSNISYASAPDPCSVQPTTWKKARPAGPAAGNVGPT